MKQIWLQLILSYILLYMRQFLYLYFCKAEDLNMTSPDKFFLENLKILITGVRVVHKMCQEFQKKRSSILVAVR